MKEEPPADEDHTEGRQESELLSELGRLYEQKELLLRAQKRGASPSFISETYATLLAAFGLRAENFRHASHLLDNAIKRAIFETLAGLDGFRVGDEVLVHRTRVGRLHSIRNGLLYVTHDDGQKPRSSNHISADNAVRLETARRQHVHGTYTRRVRETRPFRIYDSVKTFDEMSELELLSALPILRHICLPCSEMMRSSYESRFKPVRE